MSFISRHLPAVAKLGKHLGKKPGVIVGIAVLAFLVIGMVAASVLTQMSQDVRQQASVAAPPGGAGGAGCIGEGQCKKAGGTCCSGKSTFVGFSSCPMPTYSGEKCIANTSGGTPQTLGPGNPSCSTEGGSCVANGVTCPTNMEDKGQTSCNPGYKACCNKIAASGKPQICSPAAVICKYQENIQSMAQQRCLDDGTAWVFTHNDAGCNNPKGTTLPQNNAQNKPEPGTSLKNPKYLRAGDRCNVDYCQCTSGPQKNKPVNKGDKCAVDTTTLTKCPAGYFTKEDVLAITEKKGPGSSYCGENMTPVDPITIKNSVQCFSCKQKSSIKCYFPDINNCGSKQIYDKEECPNTNDGGYELLSSKKPKDDYRNCSKALKVLTAQRQAQSDTSKFCYQIFGSECKAAEYEITEASPKCLDDLNISNGTFSTYGRCLVALNNQKKAAASKDAGSNSCCQCFATINNNNSSVVVGDVEYTTCEKSDTKAIDNCKILIRSLTAAPTSGAAFSSISLKENCGGSAASSDQASSTGGKCGCLCLYEGGNSISLPGFNSATCNMKSVGSKCNEFAYFDTDHQQITAPTFQNDANRKNFITFAKGGLAWVNCKGDGYDFCGMTKKIYDETVANCQQPADNKPRGEWDNKSCQCSNYDVCCEYNISQTQTSASVLAKTITKIDDCNDKRGKILNFDSCKKAAPPQPNADDCGCKITFYSDDYRFFSKIPSDLCGPSYFKKIMNDYSLPSIKNSEYIKCKQPEKPAVNDHCGCRVIIDDNDDPSKRTIVYHEDIKFKDCNDGLSQEARRSHNYPDHGGLYSVSYVDCPTSITIANKPAPVSDNQCGCKCTFSDKTIAFIPTNIVARATSCNSIAAGGSAQCKAGYLGKGDINNVKVSSMDWINCPSIPTAATICCELSPLTGSTRYYTSMSLDKCLNIRGEIGMNGKEVAAANCAPSTATTTTPIAIILDKFTPETPAIVTPGIGGGAPSEGGSGGDKEKSNKSKPKSKQNPCIKKDLASNFSRSIQQIFCDGTLEAVGNSCECVRKTRILAFGGEGDGSLYHGYKSEQLASGSINIPDNFKTICGEMNKTYGGNKNNYACLADLVLMKTSATSLVGYEYASDVATPAQAIVALTKDSLNKKFVPRIVLHLAVPASMTVEELGAQIKAIYSGGIGKFDEQFFADNRVWVSLDLSQNRMSVEQLEKVYDDYKTAQTDAGHEYDVRDPFRLFLYENVADQVLADATKLYSDVPQRFFPIDAVGKATDLAAKQARAEKVSEGHFGTKTANVVASKMACMIFNAKWIDLATLSPVQKIDNLTESDFGKYLHNVASANANKFNYECDYYGVY